MLYVQQNNITSFSLSTPDSQCIFRNFLLPFSSLLISNFQTSNFLKIEIVKLSNCSHTAPHLVQLSDESVGRANEVLSLRSQQWNKALWLPANQRSEQSEAGQAA